MSCSFPHPGGGVGLLRGGSAAATVRRPARRRSGAAPCRRSWARPGWRDGRRVWVRVRARGFAQQADRAGPGAGQAASAHDLQPQAFARDMSPRRQERFGEVCTAGAARVRSGSDAGPSSAARPSPAYWSRCSHQTASAVRVGNAAAWAAGVSGAAAMACRGSQALGNVGHPHAHPPSSRARAESGDFTAATGSRGWAGSRCQSGWGRSRVCRQIVRALTSRAWANPTTVVSRARRGASSRGRFRLGLQRAPLRSRRAGWSALLWTRP